VLRLKNWGPHDLPITGSQRGAWQTTATDRSRQLFHTRICRRDGTQAISRSPATSQSLVSGPACVRWCPIFSRPTGSPPDTALPRQRVWRSRGGLIRRGVTAPKRLTRSLPDRRADGGRRGGWRRVPGRVPEWGQPSRAGGVGLSWMGASRSFFLAHFSAHSADATWCESHATAASRQPSLMSVDCGRLSHRCRDRLSRERSLLADA